MRGRGWFVVAGLVACVSASERVEAGPERAPRPMLSPQAFPRQMGVLGTQYAGKAPIAFIAEVDNPLTTPVNNVQVNFWWMPQPQVASLSYQTGGQWPQERLQKTVTLQPGANEVAFIPTSAVPVCGWAGVNVQLGPAGTANVDSTNRLTSLQETNCTYTGAFGSDWDTIEPDRVAAQKANVAYVNDVVMTSPPVCGTNTMTQLRFDFVNNTPAAGWVLVKIVDPKGFVVASQGVTINAPRAGNRVTPAFVNMLRPSVVGTLAIQLSTNAEFGPPIATVSPGLKVDLEGTCTIGVQPQIMVVSH
jgi:hypothetical protein